MKKKQKKDKKASKAKKKNLLGAFAKSGKKGKKSGFAALTGGQKVAGGAALVAALGLGYWGAQRRRANASTPTHAAAGAEQQLASIQEEAA